MLTLITKVVSDDSLRARIDKSIHKGTYLFGSVLERLVDKLKLKAYLSENIVYINFPKKDDKVPRVAVDTKTRECTQEDAADNDILSWGDIVFEIDGKIYPTMKGFYTHIAYPCKDGWLIYSEKHGRWIDVSVLFEEDKTVKADKFVLDAGCVNSYKFINRVLWYHRRFTRFVYSVLHTIDSCYLCLKYPFLYPRNRFTGLHYNNWKIIDYAKKLMKESVANIRIKIYNDDENNIRLDRLPDIIETRYIDEVPKRPVGKDTVLFINDSEGKEIVLYDPRHGDLPLIHKTADDEIYPKGDYVYEPTFGWLCIDEYETTGERSDFDHDDYKMKFMNIIVDPVKYKKYKVVRWWHDNVLSRIFFIPTHSEIDAMDTGWFRAFGMKMLDELKAQLKKDGMLYSYRIMQIKEKFGGLRFYDRGSTKEVMEIINKYENESYHTCIVCGRPADYITSGYILPLCKDHITKRDIATAEDLHAPKKELDDSSDE